MPFVIKLILTNCVIIGCAQLGRRAPSLAGLIAAMPITTLAALLWLRADPSATGSTLVEFTQGVVWGIVPTALFFGAMVICLKRGVSFPTALAISAGVWLAGAVIHQLLLRQT